MNSEPKVGHAYRGADGIVRWVIHRSQRGYYHVLWLREEEKIWYSGGSYRADRFPHGPEVPAPQPGDTYRRCGALGLVEDYTVSKFGEKG